MYQVKIAVDEQKSVVSFYDGENLLYRTSLTSPYHVTEQDPEVQRKKFQEGRASVPPQKGWWVPNRIYRGSWFRNLFRQVDELIAYMPFRDKEIQYFIHTPFSDQVPDDRYTVTEGFKTERLNGQKLPSRAIKHIETRSLVYPLAPAKDAAWTITEKFTKGRGEVIYVRGNYVHKHVLVFLAGLLKKCLGKSRVAVKICPSLIMPKRMLELCYTSLDTDIVLEYVWASLDIYLQNPKAYRKPWWQKFLSNRSE